MALVEHTTLRISGSKAKNGTNSAVRHEVAHFKWLRRREAVMTVT
jgi:hypothetical protein